MVFDNGKIKNEIQLQIDGVNIERVQEIKFLGVTIHDKITH